MHSQAETSSFFEASESIRTNINHKIDINETAGAKSTAGSVAIIPNLFREFSTKFGMLNRT